MAGCRRDNRWQQKTQGCAVKFPAAAAAPSDPEFHCGNDLSPPAPPEPSVGHSSLREPQLPRGQLSGSTSLLGAENQCSHIYWPCHKHPICGVSRKVLGGAVMDGRAAPEAHL